MLALLVGSISLCAVPNDKQLTMPLMEMHKAEQNLPFIMRLDSSVDSTKPIIVPKTFLQKYPSSRQFAIYTVAALFHIGAVGMATQPCLVNGECAVVDSSLWLSLVPTLANLAGTGVSLWDERKALARLQAEIKRSNEENV